MLDIIFTATYDIQVTSLKITLTIEQVSIAASSLRLCFRFIESPSSFTFFAMHYLLLVRFPYELILDFHFPLKLLFATLIVANSLLMPPHLVLALY